MQILLAERTLQAIAEGYGVSRAYVTQIKLGTRMKAQVSNFQRVLNKGGAALLECFQRLAVIFLASIFWAGVAK